MSEIRMAPIGDKHYQATILERRELSEDLWLVKIDPGGPFQFKAGQYATLGFDFEGKRIEREVKGVRSSVGRKETHRMFEVVGASVAVAVKIDCCATTTAVGAKADEVGRIAQVRIRSRRRRVEESKEMRSAGSVKRDHA